MSRALLIFAHPALERSRINRILIDGLDTRDDLHFHDLYEAYPDFYVDVGYEQDLLLRHELILWQFPLYWYSTPPLLKQWIDLTLEHGWAYGSNGIFLRGKRLQVVATAGGEQLAYCSRGYNQFTIEEFLRPLEQTAGLCGMEWLPPYMVHGTHSLSGDTLRHAKRDYDRFLDGLLAPIPSTAAHGK